MKFISNQLVLKLTSRANILTIKSKNIFELSFKTGNILGNSGCRMDLNFSNAIR